MINIKCWFQKNTLDAYTQINNINTIYELIDQERVKYYNVIVTSKIEFATDLDAQDLQKITYYPLSYKLFGNTHLFLSDKQTLLTLSKFDLQGFQVQTQNPLQFDVEKPDDQWPFISTEITDFYYEIQLQAVY